MIRHEKPSVQISRRTALPGWRRIGPAPLGGIARRALAVLILAIVFAAGALGQGDLTTKKKKIRQLQFEREQISKQLSEFRESEGELLGDVRKLTFQIRQLKARERELRRQKKRQLKRATTQQEEIRQLRQRISNLKGRAARHVVRIYRFSKLGESATLLTLARNREFFKDAYLLARAARADLAVVREFGEARKELLNKQENVNTTLENLKELEKQLRLEKDELSVQEHTLKTDLRKMRSNRRMYGKYLKEVEEVKQGMETAVVSMERRAREPDKTKVTDPNALRGKLRAPAKGTLLAGFGDQDPRYALKKFQRGVVVKVSEDTTIKAVAPGRIVHAGPFRGYQQLVVLDHGKGLFTVYGHMEKLEVERGQGVRRSAQLGTVAYQPTESSYNYYFEIRHGGKPVDPLTWLEKDAFSR